MNIQEAKQEIIHTLQAYLRKDDAGDYLFPAVHQRPILLMGPPGIGKTAIMEQVARRCGVGLVAYTITHHTRQSAIGLPHIEEKTYGGQVMSVTEYTMNFCRTRPSARTVSRRAGSSWPREIRRSITNRFGSSMW